MVYLQLKNCPANFYDGHKKVTDFLSHNLDFFAYNSKFIS